MTAKKTPLWQKLFLGVVFVGGFSAFAADHWPASRPADRITPSAQERTDALELLQRLKDAGGLMRYSCENHEAYITTSTWEQANVDTKRAITVTFGAACDGSQMTVFDSQSGKRLASVGALGYRLAE